MSDIAAKNMILKLCVIAKRVEEERELDTMKKNMRDRLQDILKDVVHGSRTNEH